MHTKDARARGETEAATLRFVRLARDSVFQRERAALAWTETVTRISETHVPDEAYESVRKYFAEKELADLTLAIVAINGWNRLAISFRTVPGSYQPSKHSTDTGLIGG